MAAYIALLRKDADSDYGVEFPDFPGVATAGSTLEEARSMAEEALAFHIEGMAEDGDALPEPSTLDRVMELAENKDAVAFLVPVREAPERVLRVNITLPVPTLQMIDTYAERSGLTRSGLLARAAEQMIGVRKREAAKVKRKAAKRARSAKKKTRRHASAATRA
jgi:predicted RNase H-like HicB family nuclease